MYIYCINSGVVKWFKLNYGMPCKPYQNQDT